MRRERGREKHDPNNPCGTPLIPCTLLCMQLIRLYIHESCSHPPRPLINSRQTGMLNTRVYIAYTIWVPLPPLERILFINLRGPGHKRQYRRHNGRMVTNNYYIHYRYLRIKLIDFDLSRSY